MQEYSEEVHRQIDNALKSRGVRYACPMCHGEDFQLLGRYTALTLVGEDRRVIPVTGGGTVSLLCAAIGCTRCGFISQHSLASLGLA